MKTGKKGHKESIGLSRLSVVAAMALVASSSGAAKGQTVNCSVQPMDYGSILPCATAGTVSISSGGGASSSGCLSLSGSQLRGRCGVIGSFFPIRPIVISVTGSPTNLGGPGPNMALTGVQISKTGGTGTITSTNNSLTVTDWQFIVNIGATLAVGTSAVQTQGSYSGSINVNVNYK